MLDMKDSNAAPAVARPRRPDAAAWRAQGSAASPLDGFGSLTGPLLDSIASQLGFRERLALVGVNRHWRQSLTGSVCLWARTKLDLVDASEDRVASALAFVSARPQGIRELEVRMDEEEQWPDVAFMLGALRPGLRRLTLAASSSCIELGLGGSGGAFLHGLRGLTSLDLDNCMRSLRPGIGQLASLQELLVSRDELSYEFEVPADLGRLTGLTRLELVRCCNGALPAELGRLTALRLLNLEGGDFWECPSNINQILGGLTALEELDLGHCNLSDVPPALADLTRLTTLSLDHALNAHSWSEAEWENKLGCLSNLERLLYLELGGNDLPAIPRSIAGLSCLETLKLGLNPINDSGLVDGAYLSSLLHLDLRGCRVCALPQHLTAARRLQFLGLSCCHDMVLDRPLAERVLGRLPALTTLCLCGQMMGSVDSARWALTLGRLLPNLEIVSNGEDGEEDEEEEEEDSEYGSETTDGDDDESEFETDEEGYLEEADEDASTDEEQEEQEEVDFDAGALNLLQPAPPVATLAGAPPALPQWPGALPGQAPPAGRQEELPGLVSEPEDDDEEEAAAETASEGCACGCFHDGHDSGTDSAEEWGEHFWAPPPATPGATEPEL